MREALQIDETYLKSITDASAGPRHGRLGHVPGTITTVVTKRAWAIMDRYFHYRTGAVSRCCPGSTRCSYFNCVPGAFFALLGSYRTD